MRERNKMTEVMQDRINTTEQEVMSPEREYGTFNIHSPTILQRKEKSVEDLVLLFNQIQDDIGNRLNEFDALWDNATDDELYKEMAFCMCTPQTNAKFAWNAVERLEELDYFDKGHFEEIAFILKDSGVRFHKNKTKYIVRNKKNYYYDTRGMILKAINGGNIANARNKLADNVLGWGMKEASHFLRNIGYGNDVCILDRHILRQLKEYGVITSIPNSMNKGEYIAIENDMRHFAQEIDIPIAALDLLFWYKAKGEIFK
jgi:N-glycosylase/DNA lyase